MHFSTVLISTFAALTIAAPTAVQKRAVFGATTYDAISISGGTAGNALAEANAVLDKLPADLSTVEESDLDFLNSVNQVANDAETDAFNVALESATGEEADALQRGKIKNKVLKLQATVLKLQAQAAQGGGDAAKLAEEETKLANNIAQDTAEAGNASTKLAFDATLGSGTADAGGDAAADDAAGDDAAADDAAEDDAAADDAAGDAAADEEEEEVAACEAKIRRSKARRSLRASRA